jgi:threonyl-tRNA synthetase
MSKLYDYPDSPLYRLRHSAAHLLAQAVLELYPDAKLGVGPPIENGFYYDFDFPEPIREDDLQRIEEKMREIAARALDIVRFETSREEAEQLIRKIGQVPYKIELLQAIPEGETISFLPAGRLHRPVPWTAHREHARHPALQVALAGGRVLAR